MFKGYSALPGQDAIEVEEQDAMYAGQLESGAFTLTSFQGMFQGLPSQVRDANSLLQFITSLKRTPPVYTMHIRGYYTKRPGAPVNTKDDDPSLLAFDFNLSLPKLASDLRSIYAVADDAPCFRGGVRPKNGGDKDYLCSQNRSPSYWSRFCNDDEAECWDEQHSAVFPASESLKKQWDRARNQRSLPPWLSMEQRTYDGEDGAAEVVNAPHVRRALASFLQGQQHHWSRRLLCSQALYGWNADMIEKELLKLIAQPQGATDWDLKYTRPITTLRIIYQAPVPLVVIRLYSTRWLSILQRSFACTIPFLCQLLSALGLVLWTIAAFVAYFLDSINLYVAILGVVPPIAILNLPVICLQREGIYDTVGAAWALKKWSFTTLPPSHSREMVVEHLQQRSPTSSSTLR